MKRISSRQAQAHAISEETRRAVEERDGGLCVWCKKPGRPEAHYIPRSRGGLGIPENILTLCRQCHTAFDQGRREERDRMRGYFERYLREHYPEWNTDNVIYRKEKI